MHALHCSLASSEHYEVKSNLVVGRAARIICLSTFGVRPFEVPDNDDSDGMHVTPGCDVCRDYHTIPGFRNTFANNNRNEN
ncbi:uncharacterized protein L969DRAFT_88812 [Mixia osmundae IAM 14324]|uniref:uncharacterized protein n=1 Tax=Mixia osmundae (strain CBS 9802 / IAM 14324 / JCM 22182 / KY 12970) TaxID=764103 RepID=UPI0004A55A30|nr:uncharacterized protein L969DRAFT_88812 [Mixia osmundae IAM 14324]KEI38372.1 hypothetical protein L969DRAFT_88812 [Mixia osmundae IAM 14324]